MADLFPNLIIGSLIDEQFIMCKHGLKESAAGAWEKDEGGCPEVIKFKNRESHYKLCPHATVKCLWCQTPLKRKECEVHMDDCPSRPSQCSKCERADIPFCKMKVPSSLNGLDSQLSQEHLKTDCPNVSMFCPQCSQKLTRKELALHIANECPLTPVKCLFLDVETVFYFFERNNN
jgi:hypothetical protein